jgi:predicted Zn-dependent protease
MCCAALWPFRLAGAEPPSAARPDEPFASAADELFDHLFGETPAEREALQEVRIGPREERQIGEAGVEALLDSYRQQKVRVLERGDEVEYVRSLVSQIHPRMRNAQRYSAIRVYVAETPTADARAFPGGSIVCTTGMIDLAASEAALVGVLAHELSHIDLGHQLRMARAMKLAQDGQSFRRRPGRGIPPQIVLMTKQFARPFRAEDEAEADRDAATWAFELGYEPLELAALFQRFEQTQPGPGLRLPNFLRTHPYNAERKAAVRQLTAELRSDNRDLKLYVGRENLERRIPRSRQRFER